MQLKYFGNAYGKWMVPTNKWQRTWPVDSWYRRGDPLVRGWVHSLAFVAGTYLYLGVGVLASSLFSGVSDFWDRTRILKCGNPSNWMCLTAYEFSFDFLVSSFFVCLFTFFFFYWIYSIYYFAYCMNFTHCLRQMLIQLFMSKFHVVLECY